MYTLSLPPAGDGHAPGLARATLAATHWPGDPEPDQKMV